MRRIVEQQPGLAMPSRVSHEHAREWAEISDILDEQSELVELVHGDLVADRSSKRATEPGRPRSERPGRRLAGGRAAVGCRFWSAGALG